MATAAAKSGALPELVGLVAHHALYSRWFDTLRVMRLVSKIFNAIATPYYFREFRITPCVDGSANIDKRHHHLLHLSYVRECYITYVAGPSDEKDFIRGLISQMPNLEGFQYVWPLMQLLFNAAIVADMKFSL